MEVKVINMRHLLYKIARNLFLLGIELALMVPALATPAEPSPLEHGQQLLAGGQYSAALEWASRQLEHPPTADSTLSSLLTLQANALRILGETETARRTHRKALQLRIGHFGPHSMEASNSYQNIGHCWLDEAQTKQAIAALDIALRIRQQYFPDSIGALSSIYLSMGEAYRQQRRMALAIETLEKSLAYRKRTTSSLKALTPVHLTLSNAYLQNNKAQAALALLQPLFPLIETGELPRQTAALIYNNAGYALTETTSPQAGLQYHLDAIALLSNKADHDRVLGHCLSGAGQAYLNLGDPAAAEPLLRRALEVYDRSGGGNRLEKADTYNDLGLCLRYQQQFAAAVEAHEKAVSLYITYAPDKKHTIAGFYENLGQCFLRQRQLTAARYYFEQSLAQHSLTEHQCRVKLLLGHTFYAESRMEEALRQYRNAFQSSSALPIALQLALQLSLAQTHTALKQYEKAERTLQMGLAQIEENATAALPNLFDYEKAQFQTAMGQTAQQQGRLNQALDFYRRALQQERLIQKRLHHEQAGLYLYSNFSDLHRNLLEVGVAKSHTDLSFIDTAFRYAEGYKGTQLRRALVRHQQIANDSLLQKRQALYRQQYHLEQRYRYEQQLGVYKNADTLHSLGERLQHTQEQVRKLDAQLASARPAYAKWAQQDQLASMRTVQQTLQSGQTFVEYALTGQQAFIFVITPDTVVLQEQALPPDFRKKLANYYTLLRTRPDVYPNQATVFQQHTRTAHEIYRLLIAPIEEWLGPELIIVPDGPLSYLPFGTLLRRTPAAPHLFARHDYLIRHHAINYAYSASLLQLMSAQTPRHQRNELLLVAPTFEDNSHGLRELSHNLLEAQTIAGIARSRLLLAAEASKQSFLTQAPSYRLLHCATHGTADSRAPDDSYLAFTEQDGQRHQWGSLLYLPEIYSLNLAAELVVLSACQTGIGQHFEGEGLISLARAFAFAGAKAVVASLWSIDDKRTHDIMAGWYQQMSEGQAKHRALQTSKLAYLQDSDHIHAHPYYWGAILCIGDPSPIADFPHAYPYLGWMIAGVALLVLLGSWLAWRYRHRLQKAIPSRPPG